MCVCVCVCVWWGGGQKLELLCGPQAPFTNKNTSKEEKMLGNAP